MEVERGDKLVLKVKFSQRQQLIWANGWPKEMHMVFIKRLY